MIHEKRLQATINNENQDANKEASCLYALITGKRSVSRRNRASWYLRQINKAVESDKEPFLTEKTNSVKSDEVSEQNDTKLEDDDIRLVSITCNDYSSDLRFGSSSCRDRRFLVTPSTQTLFLSQSIATTIILDLSPSVVSVSSKNGCVLLDSLFDALRRSLHLLVKSHEIPSSQDDPLHVLSPTVFISVIAYTPFIVAKNNQVLVQNRRIFSNNVEQVLVEIWISLNRLTREIHELVGGTCGINLNFEATKTSRNVFIFAPPISGGIIRHPGAVLDDIYELGLFSCGLMPRLSRLSILIITDGLFSSANNLNSFRLRSIAVSFISLGSEASCPDSCFGYTPYVDLMKFVAKSTQGFQISHEDLINHSQSLMKTTKISLLNNPIFKLFCWTLHSNFANDHLCYTPKASNFLRFDPDVLEFDSKHITRFFCVDQPVTGIQSMTYGLGQNAQDTVESHSNYHDWRSFKQMERNLDADFEQVLSSLLREGYLFKSIQFKHKDTSRIVARLVLHWRHNLDLEQELSAPYWSSDSFDMNENNQLQMLKPLKTPLYGDTLCEVIVHGSYSFLHNLYCDKRSKRRSEYKEITYRQFRQLIDDVSQTHERLQYLSRFYRDSSLSKVPPYLLHGNSLLYEQPHTNRLTSTVDNVMDETKVDEFQEYWQKLSCIDTKNWKNLMHVHTLRLVLEHDQPKHKNLHCQNANGRYTHVQCRRALSTISNFIRSYASFALLEDTTYIKFIYNRDDDLREIETSATKGFIVIRINKLLPTVVIYLMFTSGILDSHRVQIVNYLEDQLAKCKLKNVRNFSTCQTDNILRTKTLLPTSESCCILIKSPLERMLKVYSRNFVSEYLIHNLAHGLPGSCSSDTQNPLKLYVADGSRKSRAEVMKGPNSDNSQLSALSKFNLIFGKYLCGLRVVHTMSNLPHDVIPSLASNVLAKISTILVNLRIKQGFHIAFNNSGIINLVTELIMKDPSDESITSSCLCQYVVFPPTITNCSHNMHTVLSNPINLPGKSSSLGSSLTNSDGLMRNIPEGMSQSSLKGDNGEIKVIKEFWIEQQYGISSSSKSYHSSLCNMRYSSVIDHLYLTDFSIFECLVTYDLLQLSCDKLTPYHELDSIFNRPDYKMTPLFSPATSTNSSYLIEQHSPLSPSLPSTIIEGNTRDGLTRLPLIEVQYQFSIVNFLDYCQEASLNVLLFKDRSEFYEPTSIEDLDYIKVDTNRRDNNDQAACKTTSGHHQILLRTQRKMSVDVNEFEMEHPKREHRSSYQMDSSNTFTYMNPIYSPSLNHLFLDTLHKRLKQMHDKELQISEFDSKRLPNYLRRRQLLGDRVTVIDSDDISTDSSTEGPSSDETEEHSHRTGRYKPDGNINWRCFLRKGNQENLMIVLIPATLSDVTKWLQFVNYSSAVKTRCQIRYDPICPIIVFRVSSSMLNDHLLSHLISDQEGRSTRSNLIDSDLSLHFGQVCNYMGQLQASNDELNAEILSPRLNDSSQSSSDEKTLELVHFRAFLRKIKNTVLKSRFSSLNDAYLSELFIHKDDILYYINNVDMDTQKKYHVSSQLRSLAEFIKCYEDYTDSLPKEPGKPCDQLLNSILLQKCGLFINQPITRFNEANPLMKQLSDKKLLYMMRCNYKVELPILEENLANSKLLKLFIKPTSNEIQPSVSCASSSTTTTTLSCSTTAESSTNILASSLGRGEGSRSMDMKCGSVGSTSSAGIHFPERQKISQTTRISSSNSNINNVIPTNFNENLILDAFRNHSCSMKDVSIFQSPEWYNDTSFRHEAHLAEVLKKRNERKESHHYRRVLKSSGNYNQSSSVIDQALKRVDSLGRLEHFCLTPLLFSPSWRSKLAPVRDHTLESTNIYDPESQPEGSFGKGSDIGQAFDVKSMAGSLVSTVIASSNNQQATDCDERWHYTVCNNYIKEYEQYIQTLGFNSVQIRYSSNLKTMQASKQSIPAPLSQNLIGASPNPKSINNDGLKSPTKQTSSSSQLRKGSISTSTASLPLISAANPYNTGYLIKFLNSGCLVFKVGFCRPYVYSILYSIEGERFNNSNVEMNMTAFLDELDNIKVTMHLHSFTYDYHLRSIYSYISGRQQLSFSPGYHLISFVDDFQKYYQKAPNYARNHLLSGNICVNNLKVSGQQLYNFIVTHSSAYNMEVLEMTSNLSNALANLSSKAFIQNQETSNSKDEFNPTRSHANDYVLIELKREKVRYKDGKDLDIFDCGLLITHDVQSTSLLKNSLTLKYFLLLTNQRELYPKLLHTDDNVIKLGCHRPIRLGLAQAQPKPSLSKQQTSIAGPGHSDSDEQHLSDLQSSGETSGPQSIISTVDSTQSSSSGRLFIPSEPGLRGGEVANVIPKIKVDESDYLSDVDLKTRTQSDQQAIQKAPSPSETEQFVSSIDESLLGNISPSMKRKRTSSSNSTTNVNKVANGFQEQAICDEEITYLGYFSSEEMDMLRFLQQKTTNLKVHIKCIVHLAEIHYRRDYLWQKLMQRTTAVSNKSEEMPLTADELTQLLGIVEAFDLTTLDPQLSMFTSMHINWYVKLLKAFAELKQSSMNLNRIYTVKATKILLLFLDPKCTTAFILLNMDPERGSIELNLLLKDKQEYGVKTPSTKQLSGANSDNKEHSMTSIVDLDQDCQQLINDFINFCAAFMWSTCLA